MGFAARNPFFKKQPATPLRLEDIFTPEQEDVASDYNSDMGVPTVDTGGGFQPPQQPMAEPQPAPDFSMLNAQSDLPQSSPSAGPNAQRLSIAQSMLEHGEKPFAPGAGWWGVADRLAATGAGAWMENRENDRAEAEKAANLKQFTDALDPTDPVHRYVATIAPRDLNRAQDLLLRHETQKEIMKMKGATTAGYKQRTYNNNGQQITEQSSDGGKTWTPLATSAQFKPTDPGENLDPETVTEMAQQYLNGDKSVFMRLTQKDVPRVRNEITRQIKSMKNADGSPVTPAQVAAKIKEFDALGKGLNAIAGRMANIDSAASEVKRLIPLATNASSLVPRGRWVPLNLLWQDVQRYSSDPKLSKFAMYASSLGAAIATVAGRGTTNQFLQEYFMHKLGTATSHQDFVAKTQAAYDEALAVSQSSEDVRDQLIDNFTHGAGSIGAPAKPAEQPEVNALGYTKIVGPDGKVKWKKVK